MNEDITPTHQNQTATQGLRSTAISHSVVERLSRDTRLATSDRNCDASFVYRKYLQFLRNLAALLFLRSFMK